MQNIENIKNLLTVVVGVLLSFLGGFDILLKALFVFMIVDYITGILSGIINKKLSSKVGFKGILKKVLILFVIAIAVQLDTIMNTDVIRSITIMFYIANEGISILENTANAGAKYPQKIIDVLEQLKKEDQE